MTQDPHTDWGNVDTAAIKAHLDHDEWWDGLSDEARAEIARKRAVLGSLDDTHALNRSERGDAEPLPLAGFGIAVLGVFLAFFFRSLGWALIGGSLLWIGAAIVWAVVAGRRIAGGAR